MSTTVEADTAPYPDQPTTSLSHLIIALRVYMGLGQRTTARKLDMDRRRYQRIESGQVPCPTGFINRMVAMVAAFDDDVAAVIDAANESIDGHINVGIKAGFIDEWDRQVAYRAAVESCYPDDGLHPIPAPAITLTLVG